MDRGKIKVKLSGMSQTLLTALWGRTQMSREHSSLFYDAKAVEIVEKIDYDFSANDKMIPSFLPLLFVARAKQFDDKIREYITEHPHASVVNIGAGLDTTFYRIDNGLIHWYDLDLPAVIDVRRQLLPEPDRVTYIARSLLDPSWCGIINNEDGVFMIAGGLLRYFEESEVQQFFSMLADNFPTGEIVFDVESILDWDDFGARIEMLPPSRKEEFREIWTEMLKEMLKGWWEKAPQGQRDELIATLKLPIKSNDRGWSDINVWWNQLSTKEIEEVWRYFRALSNWRLPKWVLEDANEITKWDDRITVIDQFPIYRNIPRDPSLSIEIRQFMDYNDKRGGSSIIHVRV
jgi:O-methyltransferase involved in polyketide biosynthesis